MTNNFDFNDAEFSQTLAKIFNISPSEIKEHLTLFTKVDPMIRNCLYYLSQIEDDELKASATLSIEFLVKFKQSPFS